MKNFRILFEHPWFLFALIPALFFTVFFYFRSPKRYRCNRNRIISMVLHGIVMVLVIFVLSGIRFNYDVPNQENQLLLLVDMSASNKEQESKKDDYIRGVLDEGSSKYSVGIVLFGYDQVNVLDDGDPETSAFTTDMDLLYGSYLSAPLPDITATDYESALSYAQSLITNPKTAKVVVLSDGFETDGNALTIVRSLAADGIRVDTVHFGNEEHNEVEILDIAVPDYNIVAGDKFQLTLSLLSSYEGSVDITFYDNNEEKGTIEGIYLEEGQQDIKLIYAFEVPGLHRLSLSIESEGDTLLENNLYNTYLNLEVFDHILIIERTRGEGNNLREVLTNDTEYDVESVCISDIVNMPTTVDQLRMYDEIVLVNIANADMPKGFDEILNSYVHDYGGGLFTVGGNQSDDTDEPIANAYNVEDMAGTLYQKMLPVQAINYTPPVGVMFVLDVSGSMTETIDDATGKTYDQIGRDAVRACVEFSMTERDYCGIISLTDLSSEESPMIPVPQKSRLFNALDNISDEGGGTFYRGALERATASILAVTQVEKRHIILISDGMPLDSYDMYSPAVENLAKQGITLSIVVIGTEGYMDDMSNAVTIGGGRLIPIVNINQLTSEMRKEISENVIVGATPKEFQPQIKDHTTVVSGISQDQIPKLGGFYGTKAKEGALVPLTGEYVPIYAQWKYGEGSVGSFMCDLSGYWSGAFLENATGEKILKNIAFALFPTTNIRPSDIEVSLRWDNYTTVMSIYTEIGEGERLEAKIVTNDGVMETTTPIELDADTGFTRTEFAVKKPGVHEVVVNKIDAFGNIVSSSSEYRVFSYSAEYEVLSDRDGVAFLGTLAQRGKGEVISEPWQAFDGFNPYVNKTFDPRWVFCITALTLFLADIAVRKFKFKWIHEIIRERKTRKAKA